MTIAYALGCCAIFVLAFCRLVLVDRDNTLASVRVVFILLGSAAIAGLYWVLFRGHDPAPPDVLLVAATASVQWLAGARLWRGQVPTEYRTDEL